jgi:hypothetical protein
MPAHSLQDLANQYCALVGAGATSLTAGPDGLVAFSTRFSGFDVTLTHDPRGGEGDAMVYIFFGELPHDRETEALMGLLSANLQMREPRAPCFALDAKKRLVVLKYAYALAIASGEGLLRGLQMVTQEAARWQQNLFAEQPLSLAAFDQRA